LPQLRVQEPIIERVEKKSGRSDPSNRGCNGRHPSHRERLPANDEATPPLDEVEHRRALENVEPPCVSSNDWRNNVWDCDVEDRRLLSNCGNSSNASTDAARLSQVANDRGREAPHEAFDERYRPINDQHRLDGGMFIQ
jgi:hypothetical protein